MKVVEPAVAPGDRAGTPRCSIAPLPARATEGNRPTRVLVVDDDHASRMLSAQTLEGQGHLVLVAENGRSALEQARAERPDVVVTDVSMPVLDGFGLAEELRRDRRTRKIPLILLSGETATADKARARKLGALAYLTKPFDPAALGSLVARALSRAEAFERAATPWPDLASAPNPPAA